MNMSTGVFGTTTVAFRSRIPAVRFRRVNHRLIRALAQAQIARCDACGEDCTEWVSDILDELRVPRHLYDYTCRNLCCPQCEMGLEPDTSVQRSDPEDIPHLMFIARSALKYGRRLSAFHDFLSSFPYLGLEHPLGVALRRAVSSFPTVTVTDRHWLRARRLNPSDTHSLSSEKMWAPDPRVDRIGQGRYNHEGQCVLYLSEDLETAVAEVFDKSNAEQTGIVAVQGFDALSLERVLDVRGTSTRSLLYSALVYQGHLSRPVAHSSSWKPEYFVPRFVADLARLKGFSGIIYRTSKVFSATGLNLVVFNPQREHFRPHGNPILYERSARRESIGLGDTEIVSYAINPRSVD